MATRLLEGLDGRRREARRFAEDPAIADPQPLRKILAFNLIGSGVFLVFGIVARKGAAAGLSADPVPQAMVITGIVVAFAASALAVALTLRLFEETGRATLRPDTGTKPPDDGAGAE
jgi:multicomponent Na+:H+ antiporter subunit C